MEYEIINPYSKASILEIPTTRKPFSPTELENLFSKVEKYFRAMNKKDAEHNRQAHSISMFSRFLIFCGIEEVLFSEALLEKFRSFLKKDCKKENGSHYQHSSINSAVDGIRIVLNEYFYSKGIIQRRLLTQKAFDKYSRFYSLSQTTRKLIVAYEKDGRCFLTKKNYFEDPKSGKEIFGYRIEAKPRRLSENYKKTSIERALTFLKVIDKNSIEEITKEDLESYHADCLKQRKTEVSSDCFKNLFSIIANGIMAGILKKNPFDNLLLDRKKHKARKDFIMPDQIAKILDLNGLDWNNFAEVRNRLVTVLIYDTGLRASSFSRLENDDVKELPDGRYQIEVKGIYLKGEKSDKTFNLLFQSSISLLRYWINVIRPKFNQECSRLVFSLKGKPLTRSGIHRIVHNCCKKSEVKTVQGRIPFPHTLRHTLATLNIEPFGKALPPRLMQQRLVHMDLETLERNYIHNNPLAEMAEYKKLLEKDSNKEAVEKVSREDLFSVLDSLSSLDSSTISKIKNSYEEELLKRDGQKMISQKCDNQFIPESQVIRLLSSVRIDSRTLRSWALKNGICRVVEGGNRKGYLYQEKPFKDLVKNYMPYEQALKKYQGSRSNFFVLLKKCRTFKLAKYGFVLKDDFINFFVNGRQQKEYKVNPGVYLEKIA